MFCIVFDVPTAVVMIVANFWHIALCSPYANQRFGRKYHLHLQCRKSADQDTSVQQMAKKTLMLALNIKTY